MDFQVSSPSNHFLYFCYCLEQYSVQLQQDDGCTVNWLNSLGKGRHRCQGWGVAGRVPAGGSRTVTGCRGKAETVPKSQALQLQEPTLGDSPCPGDLMLYTPKLEKKTPTISALSQVGSVGVKTVTYLCWSDRSPQRY